MSCLKNLLKIGLSLCLDKPKDDFNACVVIVKNCRQLFMLLHRIYSKDFHAVGDSFCLFKIKKINLTGAFPKCIFAFIILTNLN